MVNGLKNTLVRIIRYRVYGLVLVIYCLYYRCSNNNISFPEYFSEPVCCSLCGY